MPANGSGSFTTAGAAVPHLNTGEVADLRSDVTSAMKPMAAITVDEWTNPVASAAAGLEAATATTVAARTVLAAGLVAGGVAALLAHPRNLTFTTAGATAADAPATALVTGTDINDAALTETVTLSQVAATAQGVKAFKTVTSIVYAAADGTGATISIGYGQKFGLSKKLKSRAGLAGAVREIAAGVLVTTGTLVDAATSAPNGTYSPATAPDGANDYCLYFEYDPTA